MKPWVRQSQSEGESLESGNVAGPPGDVPGMKAGRGLGGQPDLSSRFPADQDAGSSSSGPSLGDWPSGGNPLSQPGGNTSPAGGRQGGGSTPRSPSTTPGIVLGSSDGSGTAPDSGKVGVGLPGLSAGGTNAAKGNGSKGNFSNKSGATGSPADNEIYRKQHTLELVVTCDPQGVKVQPGGYRLTMEHLDPKEGRLLETLRGVVASRQAASPKVDLKPRVKFLVEPGGEEAYWRSRRQTIFAGLGWPIELQVAERDSVRLTDPGERR